MWRMMLVAVAVVLGACEGETGDGGLMDGLTACERMGLTAALNETEIDRGCAEVSDVLTGGPIGSAVSRGCGSAAKARADVAWVDVQPNLAGDRGAVYVRTHGYSCQ